MHLEEELELQRRLRLHDLAYAEDNRKVGHQCSDDLRGSRERRLARHIVSEMVGEVREGDVVEEEVSEGGHGEERRTSANEVGRVK